MIGALVKKLPAPLVWVIVALGVTLAVAFIGWRRAAAVIKETRAALTQEKARRKSETERADGLSQELARKLRAEAENRRLDEAAAARREKLDDDVAAINAAVGADTAKLVDTDPDDDAAEREFNNRLRLRKERERLERERRPR